MNISKKIIRELEIIGHNGAIIDPLKIYLVGHMPVTISEIINAHNPKVYVSKRSLKHIIDRRGSSKIIEDLPLIISHPTKVSSNFHKRSNSFLFARMNGKARGAVVEVTKTPDGNRVVSAFLISKNSYKKLIDVSGRAAVPPFSTPQREEKSS